MERQEAWELVKHHVANKNLRKHMLAVEAVMRHLADHFKEDKASWGLAGLLHDLDYVETEKNFARHGYKTAEILAPLDVSREVIEAIIRHPGHEKRQTKMDMALYAADPLTGLIVAATLMHPSRKLKQLDLRFLQRRFAEKRFAAGADREQIKSCDELAMSVEEFMSLSLTAMQSIDCELGL